MSAKTNSTAKVDLILLDWQTFAIWNIRRCENDHQVSHQVWTTLHHTMPNAHVIEYKDKSSVIWIRANSGHAIVSEKSSEKALLFAPCRQLAC